MAFKHAAIGGILAATAAGGLTLAVGAIFNQDLGIVPVFIGMAVGGVYIATKRRVGKK